MPTRGNPVGGEAYKPQWMKTADAVSVAVAAERERCAKIASDEQYGEPYGPQENAYNDACNRIADAIRGQKE